jgi:protein-S-isoprenylcysteine O-methyltransferase Ste14
MDAGSQKAPLPGSLCRRAGRGLARKRPGDDLGSMLDAPPAALPATAYLQTALLFAVAAAALFASAGTLAILSFWIYLAIFAVVLLTALLWLDPGMLRERSRPGGKRPPLGLQAFTVLTVVHWIVAGLDRGRFHWSDDVPLWLQAIALAVFAGGYALCLWAMAVNRFFSSVVRIQSDRGQYVVTGGPYAYVRHPGYLAGVLIMVATGVALGSWLAAALIIVSSLPFLLCRAVTEDRMLQRELPGYRDYAARVHWRVVPGLW